MASSRSRIWSTAVPLRGTVQQLLVDEVEQLTADPVHGREHEGLGQRDPHVHAPDARALLIVGLVVRAQQQAVEPDLALGDRRELVLVQILDRVLDGENVERPRLVDTIDDGGEGR